MVQLALVAVIIVGGFVLSIVMGPKALRCSKCGGRMLEWDEKSDYCPDGCLNP